MLVIDNLKPCELTTAEVISRWKTWRLSVLERKFRAERDSKESRLEIVSGLLKAIDKLDLVIKVIRASASPKEALIELVSNRALKFTGEQARAILEMKLRSLTNLDSEELTAESTELVSRLEALKVLIESEPARSKYMLAEIKQISKKFGEPRRSQLIDAAASIAMQSGGQAVTVAAVAQRAGLSRTSVYEYFASSADLVADLVIDELNGFSDYLTKEIAQANSSSNSIELWIKGALTYIADGRHLLAKALNATTLPQERAHQIRVAHRALLAPLIDSLEKLQVQDVQQAFKVGDSQVTLY
jgi:DNA gyrase/topoisomerase IV subunit A